MKVKLINSVLKSISTLDDTDLAYVSQRVDALCRQREKDHHEAAKQKYMKEQAELAAAYRADRKDLIKPLSPMQETLPYKDGPLIAAPSVGKDDRPFGLGSGY